MRVPRKAMSGSSSDDDDWIGQAPAAPHSVDRSSHSAVLTRQDITVSWLLGAFKKKDEGVLYLDTSELELWLQSMKNGRVVR
mgnify:CR=1 FL=1